MALRSVSSNRALEHTQKKSQLVNAQVNGRAMVLTECLWDGRGLREQANACPLRSSQIAFFSHLHPPPQKPARAHWSVDCLRRLQRFRNQVLRNYAWGRSCCCSRLPRNKTVRSPPPRQACFLHASFLAAADASSAASAASRAAELACADR